MGALEDMKDKAADKLNDAENKAHELKGRMNQKNKDDEPREDDERDIV